MMGETFEEWKLEDAQSLLSEQMKELLTKAQNRSKGYFKAKMLDKNLCVIWPELVSCGGENPQKKDLTNEDNVVELLKKRNLHRNFSRKNEQDYKSEIHLLPLPYQTGRSDARKIDV